MTLFSKMLVELRKEAGFSTAYQFFHKNGGKKVLGLTYAKYGLLERGVNLPRFERLKMFIYLLRIPLAGRKARGLVLAWLKTSAGEDDFKALLTPLLSKEDTHVRELSCAQETLKRALDERTYHLTPEQTKITAESPENYWCYHILANHKGKLNPEQVAKLVNMNPKKIKDSLKALAKMKIVREVKKGVFESPLAGKSIEQQHGKTLPPEILKKLKQYRESAKARGEIAFERLGIIRADKVAFRSFMPYLNNNIIAAKAYHTCDKTDNTAFFFIEGRVTKLFEF
ncbi:hypothetical protein ACFL6Y_09970 [Elusimicrobiota bacterium]